MIKWDKSLSVGVASIDQQHQELIVRTNKLLDAMLKGEGKAQVEPLVAFLGSYVVEHFGDEERLMQQHRYPGMAVHKAQHADLIKTFGEVKQGLAASGPSPRLAIELNRVLGAWLREHISTSDTMLGKFLQAQAAAR